MKKDTTISQNYYGFYRGIVIDNADPDRRGRVKVFLPEFATNIIDKVGLPNDIAYEVKFVGTSPLLSGEALEYAKSVCKWAEQAAPLVGGGSAGYIVDDGITVADNFRVNPEIQEFVKQGAAGAAGPTGATGLAGANISQNNRLELIPVPITDPQTIAGSNRIRVTDIENNSPTPIPTLQPKAVSASVQSLTGENDLLTGIENIDLDSDKVGISEGAAMLSQDRKPGTSFDGNQGSNRMHALGNSHSPTLFPNATKGLFSVPNIGANVWVFFENSNPNCPVYFAYMYDQNDWAGIHSITPTSNGVDYQGPNPNAGATGSQGDTGAQGVDGNNDPYIHRGFTVFNLGGGAITVKETQDFQSVSIASSNGSSVLYGNHGINEFAIGDKTSYTKANVFESIMQSRNVNTFHDSDEVVRGSRYVKVGKQDPKTIEAYLSWLKNDESLSKINALPDLTPTIAAPTIVKKEIKYALLPETWPILENSPVAKAVLGYIKPKSPEIKVSVPVGISISNTTQGGPIIKNPLKQNAGQMTELVSIQQAPIEKTFGEGGSQYTIIAKDKTEFVGAITNAREAVIVTKNGKTEITGIKIGTAGLTYPKSTSFQHAKLIGQLPFPVGNSTVQVGNKYSLIVGAGGIDFATSGGIIISSKITNIIGSDELNISSEHSINIKGECINISNGTDSGALVLKSPDQVVVDCNLGVSRNVIVGGGMSIEGQLCVKAISAPAEIQLTKEALLYGEAVPNAVIGWCLGANGPTPVYGGTIAGDAIPNSIKIYSHYHEFFNVPLTLHQSNINIADPEQFNNPKDVVAASPVQNGNKVPIPTDLNFSVPI